MSLINYITKIHFAAGVLEEAVRAETRALGIRRALLVYEHNLDGSDLLEQLIDALEPSFAPVLFRKPERFPDEATARFVSAEFTNFGCDGIIALGSEQCINLAKAIALLASHGGALSRYAKVEGGFGRIRDILPPVISIPTTAGSGTEVGSGALIVMNDGRRLGLVSPFLVPKVAICDPTLTLDVSPEVTASTGMDAITHCIETYLSAAYNPPADGIAIEGLMRAACNIERAVQNGRDIDARREMMAAAVNGALAQQKGLGGVHAISHALGRPNGNDFHHGALNSVVLPYVMEFNAPAVGDRFAILSRALGIGQGQALIDGLARLTERLGLPSRLAALGIDGAAIDHAAPLAEKDHTNSTNPRMASAEDYRTLMRMAL
ncbi:iron-containing alcohol dehydrogenase [Microbaculum sp. FT89]|uniref:iron-containing alcohol dehydrogenase n=1 Tax=Microbaculum sp. FT89 TaxID=3447298 RepID=UPI003F537F8F